jgi:putative heme-binding domain-containing protein
MQHDAWLETYLHAKYSQHELVFRNLGFSGDEVKTRPREDNFGSPDQWLSKCEADVVFCFFGYNEALRGDAGLPGFEQDLAEMIDGMLAQKYNGKSAPRLVIFSPIAHENLHNRLLPDGSANNVNLEKYTAVMQKICAAKKIAFVDLFHPSQQLYQAAEQPLTMNGIHLQPDGNRLIAQTIMRTWYGDQWKAPQDKEIEKLRAAVLDKNYHWFSRYRVIDGYNVYGGRSKLEWFGQSNADVMMREMEIFDVKTANRDVHVWALAQGSDQAVLDDNLPPELVVKTNSPGQLPEGGYPYLGGEEAISKMTTAPGMKVNLFASEEMFPEVVNPVQMAVDTDGRLFVSVWPSYPHWNPTQPRLDRIVCLPDEDGDGVADKCTIFADELNSITGFEFWGGGMLVSAPPEIWFLKDTDGDDKADVKVRMLQGVDNADSHHTANAMVIGPDGGLYWSRGIFHVTNMETPTKTFRSTNSGVYRFDPRTFEISFHFPIGPNPHGDSFDQWGYQFVNDGTGGTGSYVNIGKGVGNKQWFEKRVRPIAANGILSSSHFPEKNQGNFLLCNTIGFLGVLQHEVQYNGADITCKEIEPILVSTDPNFRPTDLEIGGDGALYVSDWCNALIGHMQHNIRDPNRDHTHGRIYRVTYEGRPLVKRVRLKGKPIAEVLQAFFTPEKSTRYHARLELSGRATDEVTTAVTSFANQLEMQNPVHAQAALECLWVFEEHRVPNEQLVQKVLQAEEPRVRAAAIRTLGHWGTAVGQWESMLNSAAADPSALVRAEAVKAAVNYEGLAAAEVVFQVANQPTDPELDTVINYASGQIGLENVVKDAMRSGTKMSTAAQLYMLRNASVEDLLKLEKSEAVYQAILARENVPAKNLQEALSGLASIQGKKPFMLLVGLLQQAETRSNENMISSLRPLVLAQAAADLQTQQQLFQKMAVQGKTSASRDLGFAAWISSRAAADQVFAAASASKENLQNYLTAISQVTDATIRAEHFAHVASLVKNLPGNLPAEQQTDATQVAGIRVDFFAPNPSNVAIETLAKLQPQATGIVPEITMEVPQLTTRDAFALRFTGFLKIEKTGDYQFYLSSDDGSRLYIDQKLVIDHDGLHGMSEKVGKVHLSAGPHSIVVTYFDNGGGDGLRLAISGPDMQPQKIPTSMLFTRGEETIHDIAIRTLDSIPGQEEAKFHLLADSINQGKYRSSCVPAMLKIPQTAWAADEISSLAQNLAKYVSEIPASERTGEGALAAMQLTDQLAAKLPDDQAKAYRAMLADLKVNVIRVGTVPERMIYDKERLAVQAGKPVEFIFANTDNMPHNFSIAVPGSLEEVGLLAEATARDADAMQRNYIPVTDKIILASRLLQPGESQALSFEAPTEPGIYPYVCTYPGHWLRMHGALYVVEDLKAYIADRDAYLAAHPLEMKDELLKYIDRNTEWTYDDLAEAVDVLPFGDDDEHAHADGGRSFAVSKNLFKVASCIACHKMNDEGNAFGPDLSKLEAKKMTKEHLLNSLLDPSRDIDEKFQSNVIELVDGRTVTGLVVRETKEEIDVIVDPLANAQPTTIRVEDIEDRFTNKTSTMPKGLLNKLTREEIIDLIAFVVARGDEKHPIFSGHDHQHGDHK